MSAEEYYREKKIPLIITLAFIVPPFLVPFIVPIKVYGAVTLLAALVGIFSFLLFRSKIVKIKLPDYTSVEVRSSAPYWLTLIACAMAVSDTWAVLTPKEGSGFSGFPLLWLTLIWMFEFACLCMWVVAHLMLNTTHDFSGPDRPNSAF